METTIIKKIGFGIFKDKKILMVRSHKNSEVFYLIGGKIEEGESNEDCVIREAKEEIGIDIIPGTLKLITEFNGPADGRENTLLEMGFYTGEFKNEPTPSREIAELGYFDSSYDPKHMSVISKQQIIPWLKENGYIN